MLSGHSLSSVPSEPDHDVAGIAFPTSIAVNSVIQNYSPLPSDEAGSTQKLADGDVVKICLGAHFDGFATISSET